jgi:peptide/nickel transport system substrate-binding protein
MYETQRRTMDIAERTKLVREMERYALVQAYNVPLLWWQRIVVNHSKIKGWHMTRATIFGRTCRRFGSTQ